MKTSLWVVGFVLATPLGLRAQGQSCDLRQSRQFFSVGQGAVIYLGDPVFICENGTVIRADSGVYVKSTGRADFMGNVRFTEADRSLTSQYAQYVGRERRLMAQQNVVLVDKTNGTTLRAISLDYYQKSPSNPEARIEVYSGRPHATLIRKRKDNPALVDTTNVDSDAMRFVGEKTFIGRGTVDVKRGKLTSKSNYAEFDQDGNYMRLYGQATVLSDTFKVSADSIDADLEDGDTFKELRARRDAKLESKNVNIEAPAVKVNFAKGDVERLVAVGGANLKNPDLPQAKTVSKDFTLVADSIDAKTPGGKLETVIAIGRALGQRKPDSLDAKLPELIATDWVRGDTVQAFFADSKPDTARVLQRIVAMGKPASSTYRLREKAGDSTDVSVNYITAHHIDVVMKEGAVDVVHAEGDLRGVFLQKPKVAGAATTQEKKP